MASKAFHIELRVSNIDDKERLLAIRRSLQQAGRDLHAAAKLICGDSCDPEIILFGEDFADGKADIELGSHEED